MPNKKTNIVWIGGWAADLDNWADLFARSYPNFEHSYLSMGPIMGLEEGSEVNTQVLKEGQIIVAWSLGSLWWQTEGKYLFKNLFPTLPLPRIHLVSPVTFFCREPLGWKPEVLDKMKAELERNPRRVLNNFAQRAGMPPVSSSLVPAGRWSLSALKEGLDYLKNQSTAPSDWAQESENLPICWTCGQDKINPTQDAFHPCTVYHLEDASHFPFFSHAEEFNLRLS